MYISIPLHSRVSTSRGFIAFVIVFCTSSLTNILALQKNVSCLALSLSTLLLNRRKHSFLVSMLVRCLKPHLSELALEVNKCKRQIDKNFTYFVNIFRHRFNILCGTPKKNKWRIYM